MRQIILDTETTGLDPDFGHRIIEIGCLEMINRQLTGEKFHTYLNPERDVDAGAQAISGLSLAFLQDKPKFKEIADDLINFIKGAELIIHNAPFDMGFLASELNIIDHEIKNLDNIVQVFDTLVLARRLHPGQKNNLDALCKRYGVDNSNRKYHGALLDSEILSRVYLAMTAGQTMLAFDEDQKFEQASIQKMIVKNIQRKSRDFPLKIIHATEEEFNLHLARLKSLSKESSTATK